MSDFADFVKTKRSVLANTGDMLGHFDVIFQDEAQITHFHEGAILQSLTRMNGRSVGAFKNRDEKCTTSVLLSLRINEFTIIPTSNIPNTIFHLG